MAKDGLDATVYRGWIDSTFTIDCKMNTLFSEFVVGSPAYGLSKKGRGLYDYYEYKSILDYEKLKNDLVGNIDFQYFDTYQKLKNAILSESAMNFTSRLPSTVGEHIFIYVGIVSDSDFFNAFFKHSESNTQIKTKEIIMQESEAKKAAVAIDKLFYHIRNGLAHGCYTIISQDGENYCVIQDESRDGFISARIILKLSTFNMWIEYLQKKIQKDHK